MYTNVIWMTDTKDVFEEKLNTDTHNRKEMDSMDTITVTFKIQSNRLYLFISKAVV